MINLQYLPSLGTFYCSNSLQMEHKRKNIVIKFKDVKAYLHLLDTQLYHKLFRMYSKIRPCKERRMSSIKGHLKGLENSGISIKQHFCCQKFSYETSLLANFSAMILIKLGLFSSFLGVFFAALLYQQ